MCRCKNTSTKEPSTCICTMQGGWEVEHENPSPNVQCRFHHQQLRTIAAWGILAHCLKYLHGWQPTHAIPRSVPVQTPKSAAPGAAAAASHLMANTNTAAAEANRWQAGEHRGPVFTCGSSHACLPAAVPHKKANESSTRAA